MAALPNADNVDREIREIEKKVSAFKLEIAQAKTLALTLTLTLSLTLTLTLSLTRPTARSTRWSRA